MPRAGQIQRWAGGLFFDKRSKRKERTGRPWRRRPRPLPRFYWQVTTSCGWCAAVAWLKACFTNQGARAAGNGTLPPRTGLTHDSPVPSRRPLLIMAASAVFFALMAFAAKLASAGLPGSQVAFVRFIVMLLPVVAVPRLARRAMEFQRLDLLLYRGVFGGTAVLLYFLAIAHIPVGIATLLNYSSLIFSVPFAAAFLGERVDRRLLLPLVAALGGLGLVTLGDGASRSLLSLGTWELAGLGSSILSGAALTAIRAARRTEGSWAIYGSFSLFGLLSTAPFAVPVFEEPTAREWLLLVFIGASSVVAQLLMTWAYRWVTNLQAGVISQLTVVVSMLLGVTFLGDRLTTAQVLGSVLTLGGVIGVAWLQSTPRAVE